MAEKTYKVSESGTYKVRALGSNNRFADSNEVKITIASVGISKYFISGSGESLIVYVQGTGYDNSAPKPTIIIYGDEGEESYTVDESEISITGGKLLFVITATVPLNKIREHLSTSSQIQRVLVTSLENGIVNCECGLVKVKLGVSSASYDIVSDTISVTIDGALTAPISKDYTFTLSKVPDGSFTFSVGDKEGVVGDLQEDGKTVKIQNATSQVGVGNLNAAKTLTLTKYVASERNYELYNPDSTKTVDVTVSSIAKPVLTYDAATKTLKWQTVEGATSYEVYRGDSKVTTVT